MQSLMMSLALVAAEAPIVYSKSVEGWEVFGGRGVCLMQAEFEGGVTMAVSVRAERQGTFFHLSNPAWKSISADQQLKLDVEMDRRGEWPVTAVGVEGGAGFVFSRDETTNEDGDNFIAEFALSRTIRITRDGLPVTTLSLKGTRGATLALFECRARLRSAPDFDPFANSAPRRSGSPQGNSESPTGRANPNLAPLFTDADYPASAIRAGEQGAVHYRIEVTPEGRVSDCTVRQSSGSSALDSTTCRLLRSRARFRPALDASGSPVARSLEGVITWRLPDDETPTPSPTPVPGDDGKERR